MIGGRSRREKVAHVVATWFGCGLSPLAPGTCGTIGALPLYYLVRRWGPPAIFVTAVFVALVGIWAGTVVSRSRRLKDPQFVVVDEAAGVLIALTIAPYTNWGVLSAVLLFRLFDIAKPFPARAAERLPGGWGIVLDDVVAGLWAAAGVAVIYR